MRTLCSKCLFSDYADSADPCAMGIVSRIKDMYSLETDENNFNIINDYKCLYGFDLKTYEQNKENIGPIDELTKKIYNRCEVPYYLVVFLQESDIDNLIKNIEILPVKPKYISIVVFANNNTKNIIDKLQQINTISEWKLHNFLLEESKEKALNIIFDTNAFNNDSQYIWVLDHAFGIKDIDKDINDINEIMTIYKPKTHMLCKTAGFSLNGLFISFENFKHLCKENEFLISEGIKNTQGNIFVYKY